MNAETAAAVAAPAIAHRLIKLPALGTLLPHLGGAFWGLQRALPDSGLADYPLIVPLGAEFERLDVKWGGYGKDVPGATCKWDGLANTRALLALGEQHPVVHGLNQEQPQIEGLSPLYLPSQRELQTLHANGCDAFNPDRIYWSSTQYSRSYAWLQYFAGGYTSISNKGWSGGAARFVRRSSLELLIP